MTPNTVVGRLIPLLQLSAFSFQLSLLAVVFGLFGCRKTEPASDFVVFDDKRGCDIAISASASEAEQRAAKLLQETLAKASGKGVEDFLIRRYSSAGQAAFDRRESVIFISGSNHRKTGEGRLAEKVTLRVSPGRVDISSYPADAIEVSAAWFLREALGARWFMPGPLGEHVPPRAELRLPLGERTYSPSYISRNLGLGGASPEERAWWGGNRLRAWFRHTHAMNPLFTPEDLRRNPDFAALVNGRKNIPATAREGNWQPNIAAEGAAEHAAAVLAKRREFSSPIGMNDSIRYDQSDRTRALLGEPRWFRLKPDFSPLVFGFVNDVAKRLPGRYLGAYAYDWTEDTPGFRVERNVVPYLTADRSEWFDPALAEQDQALIRRWVAAGPEVVGLYDYYYGAPYLVPRPTLYAVARAIPFAHEAGVRAFYAEVYPNWGLDGPKAWLAAELLWHAAAKPEDLLDLYYHDFWREAAGPMREYFERCDQQWLTQPKPSYWIKYFKDEHQHLLFPAEVRQRLRSLLAAARTAATTELTRQRVEFFAQAFAVTDSFCAWEEAKERLSRAALATEPDQAALREAWHQLDEAEVRLKQTHAKVAKEAPLAVKATILGDYERNDPRRRAAMRLKAAKAESGKLKAEGPESKTTFASIPNDWTSAFSFQVSAFPLRPSGTELLKDAALSQLSIGSSTGFFDLEWVESGPWRGHGEPYETRQVTLQKAESGKLKAEDIRANSDSMDSPQVAGPKPEVTESSSAFSFQPSAFASLVMRGCKQETFSQIVPAEAGKWYVARVKVRAKVSPGNMTFLILNFQDEVGQTMGQGFVDRLPVGEWGQKSEVRGRKTEDAPLLAAANPVSVHNSRLGEIEAETTDEGVELVVWAQAPAKAKWVGLGVRALNQVGDDFGEFSGFSLQRLEER